MTLMALHGLKCGVLHPMIRVIHWRQTWEKQWNLKFSLPPVSSTCHWLDPGNFTYPESQVPWEPAEGEGDPAVAQLREDLNYSYADIITVTALVESFWEEHHHEHETIRWALDGAGYFDIRDVDDEWVRIHIKKGDFFTWPAGINHRFSVDSNSSIQAMRLFKGSPIWTAYPRDEVFGNHTARNDYVDTYLCGEDPDLVEGGNDGSMDTSSAISMFGFVSKSALAVSLAASSVFMLV